ncbi:MAG: hypothetical protein KC731_09960 [Myxococcales bacterium]|nr:hypothetical protein [Myxococcales bacterium]
MVEGSIVVQDRSTQIFRTPKRDFTYAELRERVRVVEPGIVYFLELPGGRVENFQATLEIVEELAAPFDRYVVILDLAEASRPSPAVVEAVLDAGKRLGIQWCVVQSSSRLMKAVVQFVTRRTQSPYSLHDSVEEAVSAARAVLAAAH